MKQLLTGICAMMLTMCATTAPDPRSLTKDEIKLERERIAVKREEIKDRWWNFAGLVGRAGLDLGVSWARSKLDGFQK